MIQRRRDEYFVVTISHGRPPVWTWEIERRPIPLGIIISGAEFNTESAAKLAGEKALAEFLARLEDEERGVSAKELKRPREPPCEKCGARTLLQRVLPSLGTLPQLFVYRCTRCRHFMKQKSS